MRKLLSTPVILTLLLVVATATAIYYGSLSSSLQNRLEELRSRGEKETEQLAFRKELRQIDSLLLEGRYSEALNSYKARKENEAYIQDGDIELRVTLVGELLRLQYKNDLASLELREEQESNTEADQQALYKKARKNLDSLSFALEKSRVQVRSLRKQLTDRTFGEYLTFSNSRGSQMHYVGQVKHGKAHGYGVALLNTGSRYVGTWKNNQRHGEGTYYWADGQYYKGSFKNDKREGEGTYYWPNGEKYVGHWKEDQRSGEGVFYGKNGQVIADGVWKDDKLAVIDEDKRVRGDRK